MHNKHCPVLLNEAIEGLAIQEDGIYVDATFGRGGHSVAILKCLGPEGRLIALDKDPEAISIARTGPFQDPRFQIVHASFATLGNVIKQMNYVGAVGGILFDLGVSSPQLENPQRGFSFLHEGPLDMRMNPHQGMDAATWIDQATAADIAKVLYEYGEERHARRIATAIITARRAQPIETTHQLAQIISRAHPNWEKRRHPATRSFQAIRIFINNELKELKDALAQCYDSLKNKGRLCVISFHSLEDRLVKQFIAAPKNGISYPPDLPIRETVVRSWRKIGHLIRPTTEEVTDNPRARSARLRIAEKIS